MSTGLEEIESIINGYNFAKDKDRVFTYIEFVKMFGFEHNSDTFITHYKDYVTQWANVKNEEITLSDEEFVLTKLIEILKSITLDYSSYEEQDFISHVDLTNKEHLKALIAIYSRKIRQITEFYRKKRNESVLIVNRNSFKGAAKSIQEIIYEKVFDYLFSDRNIVPSYVNIKRDLLISVENYVDIYSEYFDIPRERKFTDKTRAEMLSANMNDIDYRVYLDVELVVSEILFSGNVFLEEIPLIAQLAVDLSQNCVGSMQKLKEKLVANTTVNQVPLTEQVALKRRLYEKFLGCDLYYLYVDLQGGVKMDVLCRADNPTGNLLNCGTADTATIENEQLELLSHIGLFFKPDKTSILKVNAKSFVWSIDEDALQPDTMYVFPDPSKYGDIGNNKSSQYPLIMEYKLDYDVRNMSSGESCDDPLMLITDQGWRSYYSKQDDDFKLVDNNNYEYSFTYLANQGFIHKYQTDAWGNQFGILKGCKIDYNYDENGEVSGVKSITLPKNLNRTEITYHDTEIKDTGAILLNGGYFEDPFYKGERTLDPNTNEFVWTYKGDVNDTRPFDFEKILKVDDYYNWSGLRTKNESFYYSNYTNNSVNFGTFGSHSKVQYIDNFQNSGHDYAHLDNNDAIINEVLLPFVSKTVFDEPDYEIIEDETTWDNYDEMGGEMYIKLCNSLYEKPKKFNEVFDWVNLNGEKITNIHIIHETLIIETKNKIKFVPYNYNGEKITSTLGLREMLELDKSKFLANKVIFLEQEKKFFIIQIDSKTFDNSNELSALSEIDGTIQTKNYRRFIIPRFYRFDPISYTITDIVHFSDPFYRTDYENNLLHKTKLWSEYVEKKEEIINKDSNRKLWTDLLSRNESEYSNLRDFEIYYKKGKLTLENFDFTYTSSLGIFLLSLSLHDVNNTPYVYEYKFKLTDVKTFNDSLRTNVYTLKNEDVGFKWNDKINAYNFSTYPANFKTLGENTIFEYTEKSDFGEGGSFFNGNKYKAKFDQVENDFTDYDEKYHVGYNNPTKWFVNIGDTFGKSVTCDFSSDCFISDGKSLFERQERIKTVCDLLFTIDDYIRIGENDCSVRIRKLESEGRMNRVYDFLDNGEQPFLGQTHVPDPLWYEVFFARDLTKEMTVHADALGNVCGHCSIPFEVNTFTAVNEGEIRIVYGELRLCLYGHATEIKAEAHMNVFDITTADSVSQEPEIPDVPDIPDEPDIPDPSVTYAYNTSGKLLVRQKRASGINDSYIKILEADVSVSGQRISNQKGEIICTLSVISSSCEVEPTELSFEVSPKNTPDDGSFGSVTKTFTVRRQSDYEIEVTISSDGEDVNVEMSCSSPYINVIFTEFENSDQETTVYDISAENGYVPYANDWNENVFKKYGLTVTKVENGKMFSE